MKEGKERGIVVFKTETGRNDSGDSDPSQITHTARGQGDQLHTRAHANTHTYTHTRHT